MKIYFAKMKNTQLAFVKLRNWEIKINILFNHLNSDWNNRNQNRKLKFQKKVKMPKKNSFNYWWEFTDTFSRSPTQKQTSYKKSVAKNAKSATFFYMKADLQLTKQKKYR